MNKTDVQDKVQELKEKGENFAQDLREKMQDKAKEIQKTAQQWQRQAARTTKRAARATDEYVHDNAWTVVASVAIGFFTIGFLLGRSRD